MPPGIIENLAKLTVEVTRRLSEEESRKMEIERVNMSEKTYRWMLNGIDNLISEDEIGNEKLCDGIRIFARDQIKLENIIKAKLSNL
jgi:transaldolase